MHFGSRHRPTPATSWNVTAPGPGLEQVNHVAMAGVAGKAWPTTTMSGDGWKSTHQKCSSNESWGWWPWHFFFWISERGSWFLRLGTSFRLANDWGHKFSRYFLIPSFLPVTKFQIPYKTDQWGFGLGWLILFNIIYIPIYIYIL